MNCMTTILNVLCQYFTQKVKEVPVYIRLCLWPTGKLFPRAWYNFLFFFVLKQKNKHNGVG